MVGLPVRITIHLPPGAFGDMQAGSEPLSPKQTGLSFAYKSRCAPSNMCDPGVGTISSVPGF